MAAVPDKGEAPLPGDLSIPEARSDVWSDLRAVKRIESTQRDINGLKMTLTQLQRRWLSSVIVFAGLSVLLVAGLVYLSVQMAGLRQQLREQSALSSDLSLGYLTLDMPTVEQEAV